MKLLFKQSRPSTEELRDREELLEEERDSLGAMERAEEEAAGAGATGVAEVVRLLCKRPETVAEFWRWKRRRKKVRIRRGTKIIQESRGKREQGLRKKFRK